MGAGRLKKNLKVERLIHSFDFHQKIIFYFCQQTMPVILTEPVMPARFIKP